MAATLILATVLFLCACGKRAPDESMIVERLCEHIVKDRQKMIVDQNGKETIWSDGAILERGSNFPEKLQHLITDAHHHTDIQSYLEKYHQESDPPWKQASAPSDLSLDKYVKVTSADGSISALFESIYLEYLRMRHPNAEIKIRTEQGPILFYENDQICAAIMPMLNK